MKNCRCPSRPRRERSPIYATNYHSIFFVLAVAVSAISFVTHASAAEITFGQNVILEGQIEPGDYDKMRDFLVAKRDYDLFSDNPCSATYEDGCPEAIYRASPGGDVAEAMKIGRLVRALGWDVIVPTRTDNSAAGASLHQTELKWYKLGDPKANFMCASACFFIFVGGISKDANLPGLPPVIGIHRPYLETERLKDLRGGQALAAADLTKTAVETYLKEMDVPTKYFDQMFLVPKDKILWISDDDFDADFAGLLPSLRDWVDAKCKLTDVEKVALEAIRKKSFDKRTQAEWDVEKLLDKKQGDCKQKVKFELRKDAWERWRKETLQKIADTCPARKSNLPGELEIALSMATPNRQSAAAALSLAQTAGLCRNYEALRRLSAMVAR